MFLPWGRSDGEHHRLLFPHWDARQPSLGLGVGFLAPSSPDTTVTQPLQGCFPARSLLACLQGKFLVKPHDMTLASHPKQGASDHQGCGVSPGIGVCLHWVCLSMLGCIAIAAGNDSLFSLQNSLKKRGSRSIGKTEKKPSVQVLRPGHAVVVLWHRRSWCQD